MIADAPPFDYVQPQDNYGVGSWSTPEQIDARNVQPGIVRQTTPEQDAWLIRRNEDERMVALGINPIEARKAQLAAEEQAIRFQGQQEYTQLISGGAKPEEALRRTAGKLFWNHPDKLAMALDRVPEAGLVPGSVPAVPILGAGGERIGDAVYDARGRIHSSRFAGPPKMPAEIAAQQKVDSGEIATLRKDFERAKKDAESSSKTPDEKADAARRAMNYRTQLEAAEKGFVMGSTNYPGGARGPVNPTAPAKATAPASDEKVIVIKDGKRFRLPKSQLDEALKSGYKLAG